MPDRILVVNPGSSSLKLSVVGGADSAPVSTTAPFPQDIAAALRDYWKTAGRVDAVGVRVVHGGDLFTRSVRVTERTMEQLQSIADLAPLHNPPALAALRALTDASARVPVVACFDTAFHATLSPAAATYALPEQWRRQWPLRRFGFHGLSHAYAAGRAAQLMHREGDGALRLVTGHLGAGASLAAVVGGVSADTTMGFTPLDGLVMATRSGAVDPGLLLWLCRHAGMKPEEIERALETESGLLGLAGTADMRDVLSLAKDGHDRAVLARDVYIHRLCGLIASMVASMQGVDGVVFTGGVGEGSAEIRSRTCARLGHLGIAVNAAANDAWAGYDGSIAAADTPVDVLVVVAHEDVQIAREVRQVLG